MSESCAFYPKLYRVVINIWVESSDNLVEKKRDRKWSFIWVTSWFLCLFSYSQGMFEYPKNSRFPSKSNPTLKALMIRDDYAIYLWFDEKWLAKLIYDIWVIGIEMKHLPVRAIHLWEVFLCLSESGVFSNVL